MPGVQFSVNTQTSGGSGSVPANATMFASGLVNRGPVGTPITALSLTDLIAQVDGPQSFGAIINDATAYFGESAINGKSTGTYVVSRVVGPSATVGTGTLMDGAGTPLATITVNAANPGAWSSGVTVAVTAGPFTNTFNLTVTYGSIVEQYNALASPAAAVTAVNSASQLIQLVNAASATAAPNNNPAPASVTLSAGSDDRTHVTASTLIAGLATFGSSLGSGMVGIPGQLASAVQAGIEAHCATFGRIGLSSAGFGQTVSEVSTLVKTLIGNSNGQYDGLVWPNVQIPNGNSGSIAITPEGAVAGLRARVQATTGPWQPPAGGAGIFQFVTATEPTASGLQLVVADSDADNLDTAGVSVIRQINGGPRLYGWRSLSADLFNYELLSVQDLINYIKFQGTQALEQYVFKTIDGQGQLLGKMGASIKNIIVPIVNAGGCSRPPTDPTRATRSTPARM
jgi:hypothetical protein